MFEVFLAAFNGPEEFAGYRSFAVPPRMGDDLMLKANGRRHYYRVIDALHFERPDGTIGYNVDLTWQGPVGSGSPKRASFLRLVQPDSAPVDGDDE